MSDPVTNVDVEDVLSSIRRLVSDTNSEDRQEINASEPAQPVVEDVPVEAVKPAEALILTSALRVDAEEADSVPEFRHTEMSNLRHTLGEDTHTDGGNAEADQTDWAALADDEYYEDDEQVESAPVIDFIRHGKAAEAEVVPEQGDEAVEHGHQEEAAEDHAADDADTADANEVQAEEAQSGEEHSTDFQDWGNEEDQSSDEHEAHAEAVDHADEQKPAVDPFSVDEIEFAEEPEEAVSTEDVATEDHASEADATVEEAEFVSAATASVMEDAPKPKRDDIDLADFDESVIDEDALRDLVAEIVREELTGDLGERITRNVRKLVRREIHRALLTREFE